jgi:hypothetical protein
MLLLTVVLRYNIRTQKQRASPKPLKSGLALTGKRITDMATKQATKTPTTINQATVCRCTDKATHEVFYAVKSDSSNKYYLVRWNEQAHAWQCNCVSRKPCKHERAVGEVLAARRTRIAAKIGGETPAIVAKMQAQEDAEANRRAAFDIQVNPWFA